MVTPTLCPNYAYYPFLPNLFFTPAASLHIFSLLQFIFSFSPPPFLPPLFLSHSAHRSPFSPENEAVSWIWRSCGDRTDIGKANLWFVLKCRSSPAVILRPFRNDSEQQPSQPIVYVRFDRADAMVPLLVNVKYTYHGIHLDCLLGSLGGRHLPCLAQNRRYACASSLPLASRSTDQPGRFKPPGRFIPPRFGL